MDNITHIIAIDGPAGAGKSSVAKEVARILGYAFLDTGSMYRAATWRALELGIDLDDSAALAASTAGMALEMDEGPAGLFVKVDGCDVSEAIRSPEVTRQIYRLDQNREVRAHLVALQRAYGAKGPTVAEGRDIGTVVFAKARCKVYLDASVDERTRRRTADLAAKGIEVDVEALREEIRERDEKSMTRKESPLRRADDAVLVDTTYMTQQQVVERIVSLARAAE